MNWSQASMTWKKRLRLNWKGGMSLVLATSFALLTACGTQAPAESGTTALPVESRSSGERSGGD